VLVELEESHEERELRLDHSGARGVEPEQREPRALRHARIAIEGELAEDRDAVGRAPPPEALREPPPHCGQHVVRQRVEPPFVHAPRALLAPEHLERRGAHVRVRVAERFLDVSAQPTELPQSHLRRGARDRIERSDAHAPIGVRERPLEQHLVLDRRDRPTPHVPLPHDGRGNPFVLRPGGRDEGEQEDDERPPPIPVPPRDLPCFRVQTAPWSM